MTKINSREDRIATLRLKVDVTRNAYVDAKAEREAAQNTEADALDQWSMARIALAKEKGHRLAGKRFTRKSGPPSRRITITGTVVLCEKLRTDFNMRRHSPVPGEWFLISDSGKTGYTLEHNAIERHNWKPVE